MRACVIFNPAARGEKARQFARFLTTIAAAADLRPTTGPGTARPLAREAADTGYDLVIAAGGDGTVFEVLNGIADSTRGFDHTALSVLPFGTANVFARELGIPPQPDQAWAALQSGSVRRIDCGLAEFKDPSGNLRTARFVIVAGAGLDARAVQLVDWNLKRRAGKLAYISAACRAYLSHPDLAHCTIDGRDFTGRAVLIGNGRFYAGDLAIFPDGNLESGLLHVRGVRKVTPGILARCLGAYLTGRWTLDRQLTGASVPELRLTSDKPVPLQLDGEFVGWLPATLRILPASLQVIAPGTPTPTPTPKSTSITSTPAA
ncbi:MAG: diacylglycerol kinase family protein [Limisphaerales bacterium]